MKPIIASKLLIYSVAQNERMVAKRFRQKMISQTGLRRGCGTYYSKLASCLLIGKLWYDTVLKYLFIFCEVRKQAKILRVRSRDQTEGGKQEYVVLMTISFFSCVFCSYLLVLVGRQILVNHDLKFQSVSPEGLIVCIQLPWGDYQAQLAKLRERGNPLLF